MNSPTTESPANHQATDIEDLEPLFRPKSIAVVGASSNKASQGYEFVQGLVEIGFPGPVYPVNPRIEELHGLKAYPDLQSIPGTVDFVISAVPAQAVLGLVEGAVAKQVKLIHFFTARFSETGREDAAQLELELKRRIKEAGIRVIGPNCMGLYYPKQKITFDPILPSRAGNVGFLSQSGSHVFRVIQRGADRGVGFTKAISYGNAMDLNEGHLLDHFAEDPDTEVIAAYIEGIRDGRHFFSALKRAAAKKPVIVLKGGRTEAGQTAAQSHTASLASERAVWQAALRQAGAIEATSLNEMIDLMVAFVHAGPAEGRNVAILGGAGGEMVETADLCHEAGLNVLPLPPEVRESLKEKLPNTWDWVGNPIDASILEWGRNEALEVIQAMAASPHYHAVLANIRWLEHTLNREDGEEAFRRALEYIKGLAHDYGKATVMVMGEPEAQQEDRWRTVRSARSELSDSGVALFPDIERAAHTLGKYADYFERRRARA